MAPRTIERAELEGWLGLLCDQIFAGRTSIEIQRDYYWNVTSGAEAADIERTPTPAIGQISEDLQTLRQMAADPSLRIGWDMAVLGRVLLAIGHENVG